MASVKIVRAKYRKFPTLFELQNVKLTIAEVDSIIGKLEREKEAPATVEEFESDVRSLNFLAYLHLRQLQPDKAKPLVEDTLQKEPRNVTALANKCELHLQYFEITEAEAALRTLESVSENKESIAIALSELAYSLSRCGPCSHLSAATKFAEAIEVGQSRCLPEKLVAWHYGMALSYNRSLALEHILENPGVDVEENFKMAIAALAYVAKSDHKFLKAKAYVILGEITKHYWRDVKRVQGNMSHVIVKLPEESLTVFECFERAYELAPEDHWVLGRFGRHLRHVKQHERALEMLNRACDLCPSAFTRHHQGLVYRSMAYEANNTANAGRGRSHRGHPRSRGYQQRRDSEGRGAHGGFTADIYKPAVTLLETGDSARGVPTTAAGTPSPAALPTPSQTRSRRTPDAGPSGTRDRDVDGPPIATGGLHPVAPKTPSRSRSAGGPPPIRDGPFLAHTDLQVLSHTFRMEKKNEIQERYMKFPNLFQLEYNKQLEKQVMTKLERKKSCSATAEEFESDVCNLNCLAFLHLKRQTLNRAKPIVAEVLAKDPQNITALANQCELLLLSYDFKKAAEVLGELEAQRDNEGANAMALAEQGYFLSRMGPRVYLQAIEKFEQAIEKGRGHCSQDKIIFWHYNIALNYDSQHRLVMSGRDLLQPIHTPGSHNDLAFVTGSPLSITWVAPPLHSDPPLFPKRRLVSDDNGTKGRLSSYVLPVHSPGQCPVSE
ncbi:uncharacterized protein LOC144943390 [Lampetra fluviatilis]